MLAGAAESMEARNAITPKGKMATLDVLMAAKRHMASVATPGRLFSLFNSIMALSPKGVAAFPKPSMLAERFMIMALMPGCSAGTPGKVGASAVLTRGPAPEQTGVLRHFHDAQPKGHDAHKANGQAHRRLGTFQGSGGYRLHFAQEGAAQNRGQHQNEPNPIKQIATPEVIGKMTPKGPFCKAGLWLSLKCV